MRAPVPTDALVRGLASDPTRHEHARQHERHAPRLLSPAVEECEHYFASAVGFAGFVRRGIARSNQAEIAVSGIMKAK
jgi:hypothetical protein